MMKWLRRLREERSQAIILFVGIFSIIMLVGAITIDFGLWFSERRGMERAADAAALAGAQDLPTDGAAAKQDALRWAERNGYEDGKDGVTVSAELFCANTLPASVTGICHANPCGASGNCDSIRVTISKPGPHLFSEMFNIGDVQVGFASAAGVELEGRPMDVVMVIDTTGSMRDQSGGDSKINWAKQAAVALVNLIAGGSSSSTLGSNQVEVLTFAGAASATRVITFSSDAVAVRNAINGISNPTGDTDIAEGIEAATSDLNAHVHNGSQGSYKAVVLLSDGRNFANGDPKSGTTCDATHQRRADTVSAIPGLHAAADTVYTVGVGSLTGGASDCDPYQLDEALLQDIVKGPPGTYKRVVDASTLPGVFQMIGWKIAGRALTE